MAPGRREGGGWGRGFLQTQGRPGRSLAADLFVPRRPVAGALGRRAPARQVIVRSGAKGACRIVADPCVLARCPPANPRSLGERQRRLFVRRSRCSALSHVAPFPGSGFLAGSQISVLAQSLLSKRRPGAVLLLRAGRVLAAALGSGRPRLGGCRGLA